MAVELLNMRHVAAIIGSNVHDCATAAVANIMDKRIPLISPAGVQPDITKNIQQDTVYPYVFRTAFLHAQQRKTMAAYTLEACHAQKKRYCKRIQPLYGYKPFAMQVLTLPAARILRGTVCDRCQRYRFGRFC